MASWGVSPSPKDRTRPQPTTKGKGNKANWGYSYQPTIEENPFSDWADTHRHMASPSRQRPTATTKEKPRWKRSTDTTDQFPRLADSPARAYGRSGAETGGGVFTPRGGGKETWKRYDLPPLGTAQLDETVVKGTLGPRISNPQSSFGKQTLGHKKNEPATVFSRTDRVAASRLFVRSDNPNRHVQDSVEQAEFYEGGRRVNSGGQRVIRPGPGQYERDAPWEKFGNHGTKTDFGKREGRYGPVEHYKIIREPQAGAAYDQVRRLNDRDSGMDGFDKDYSSLGRQLSAEKGTAPELTFKSRTTREQNKGKYIGGGFEREDLNRDSPGPAANYDAAPSSLGTQRTSKYNTAPAHKWAPSRNLKPGEDVNLMNARVAKADRNGVVLFARKPLDTPGPGAYF